MTEQPLFSTFLHTSLHSAKHGIFEIAKKVMDKATYFLFDGQGLDEINTTNVSYFFL